MKQQKYKKSFELKNAAKDKLEGKYGSAILVCFLCSLIQYVVTFIVNMSLPSPTSSAGISIPLYVVRELAFLTLAWVFGVMELGLDLFFLKTACGQTSRISDLFYGYHNDFSKALTISGIYALVSAVCELPGQYLLVAFLLTQRTALLLPALIASIAGLCIYLPFQAGLFLTYFLMLDFPDKTAKEILTLSFQLIKGSKKRVLYLIYSFIPLMLLCACSLNIGLLWLTPYMRMTYACFFLDLMNPHETT